MRTRLPVRVGTVLWPVQEWPQMAQTWQHAEDLGFDTAWLYDHLAWRGHAPWDEAYTSLAAGAAVTSSIRLGTLVTSPNFRDPLPTAAAVRTLTRISGGRLRLGIGAGGDAHTSDGDVLGRELTPRERADRFAEYLTHLDALLTTSPTSTSGDWFRSHDVRVAEGLPAGRPPFLVAGNGPRGMRLAAQHGTGWIANPQTPGTGALEEVRGQVERLAGIGAGIGRDTGAMEKVLLTGFTGEPWLESLASFRELLDAYTAVGITDVALHWPRPDSDWDADPVVFESIARWAAEHTGNPGPTL